MYMYQECTWLIKRFVDPITTSFSAYFLSFFIHFFFLSCLIHHIRREFKLLLCMVQDTNSRFLQWYGGGDGGGGTAAAQSVGGLWHDSCQEYVTHFVPLNNIMLARTLWLTASIPSSFPLPHYVLPATTVSSQSASQPAMPIGIGYIVLVA